MPKQVYQCENIGCACLRETHAEMLDHEEQCKHERPLPSMPEVTAADIKRIYDRLEKLEAAVDNMGITIAEKWTNDWHLVDDAHFTPMRSALLALRDNTDTWFGCMRNGNWLRFMNNCVSNQTFCKPTHWRYL